MPSYAIIDAGPLFAWVASNDPHHRSVVELLRKPAFTPVIPALVVCEAAFLVQTRVGPDAEVQFIESLSELQWEQPTARDLVRMAELMRQYRDFPLGAADASVVALAERLDTDIIVTTDRRHFSAVRPKHCPAFRLLPERPAN